MDARDVGLNLAEDWLPGVPAAMKTSLFGWPVHLLECVEPGRDDALALTATAGRAERQWKGFLSWMLGVAGTRQVLRKEGYRWVAPLSAFYADAGLPVGLGEWPPAACVGRLLAYPSTGSNTRLRPDYVAIRFMSAHPDPLSLPAAQFWASAEVAIAESKGTSSRLTKVATCRKEWKQQVENCDLEVDGVPFAPHRRLVVATRVNPNAAKAKTRKIQIRAWNSAQAQEAPNTVVALEIINACLYGVARELQLEGTAAALARAPWRRRPEATASPDPFVDSQPLEQARRSSGGELQELAASPVRSVRSGSVNARFMIGAGGALINLMRNLSAAENVNVAADAVLRSELELRRWDAEAGYFEQPRRSRASRMGLELSVFE